MTSLPGPWMDNCPSCTCLIWPASVCQVGPDKLQSSMLALAHMAATLIRWHVVATARRRTASRTQGASSLPPPAARGSAGVINNSSLP